jgi:DNA repair protein RadA/Sms
VFFGEISLSGEIRAAPQPELRLKEAVKLGFSTAVVPPGIKAGSGEMVLKEIAHVGELATLIGAREKRARETAPW